MFRTEKTNARTPGVNAGDPPTVLEGEQRVTGIELGASGRISRPVDAAWRLLVMSSDIEASNTPAEVDNALAMVPEHTFNLWTTYEFPWKLTLGGGVQYMDSVFRNAANSASVPSYWLLNTLVSYEVNRHLTLRLNGTNLADEEYVDRIGGGSLHPRARTCRRRELGDQVLATEPQRFCHRGTEATEVNRVRHRDTEIAEFLPAGSLGWQVADSPAGVARVCARLAPRRSRGRDVSTGGTRA